MLQMWTHLDDLAGCDQLADPGFRLHQSGFYWGDPDSSAAACSAPGSGSGCGKAAAVAEGSEGLTEAAEVLEAEQTVVEGTAAAASAASAAVAAADRAAGGVEAAAWPPEDRLDLELPWHLPVQPDARTLAGWEGLEGLRLAEVERFQPPQVLPTWPPAL